MKFVVAVVMLALAVGVNSSLLTAHIAPAVSYVTSSLHPAPLLAYPGPYAGHGLYGGPAAISAWGGPSAHGYYGGIPGISLSQGPIGHAVAAPIVTSHGLDHSGHSGVYVAKTRGAVHTAPLPGHVNSATSLNLAPAPGTH